MLKKAFTRFPDLKLIAFLRWVVAEWTTVFNHVYPLKARFTRTPNLKGIVYHIEAIVDLYRSHTGPIYSEGNILQEPKTIIARQKGLIADHVAKIGSLQKRIQTLSSAQPSTPAVAPMPYRRPGQASMNRSPILYVPSGNPDWDKPVQEKSGLRPRRIKAVATQKRNELRHCAPRPINPKSR